VFIYIYFPEFHTKINDHDLSVEELFPKKIKKENSPNINSYIHLRYIHRYLNSWYLMSMAMTDNSKD